MMNENISKYMMIGEEIEVKMIIKNNNNYVLKWEEEGEY